MWLVASSSATSSPNLAPLRTRTSSSLLLINPWARTTPLNEVLSYDETQREMSLRHRFEIQKMLFEKRSKEEVKSSAGLGGSNDRKNIISAFVSSDFF